MAGIVLARLVGLLAALALLHHAALWLREEHGVDLPRGWALLVTGGLGSWVLYRALGLDRRGRRRRKLLGYRLADLDTLSGEAFESWIATVLDDAGFHVVKTPRTGDYGVDLIASRNGMRVGIEAKRRAAAVSNDVVRSVVAGCQYHECHRAAVVTQATFTRAATHQAERADVPVILIGRTDLPRLTELLMG